MANSQRTATHGNRHSSTADPQFSQIFQQMTSIEHKLFGNLALEKLGEGGISLADLRRQSGCPGSNRLILYLSHLYDSLLPVCPAECTWSTWGSFSATPFTVP